MFFEFSFQGERETSGFESSRINNNILVNVVYSCTGFSRVDSVISTLSSDPKTQLGTDSTMITGWRLTVWMDAVAVKSGRKMKGPR